jgi:hypothetical protein
MRKISPFAFALLSLISCELVIDIDQPDFESSLVVQGEITNEQNFQIFVSKDYYILDQALERYGESKGLTDVEIELFEDDQLIGSFEEIIIENEYYAEPIYGYYQLDELPSPGKTYTINVSKDGFKTVQASTTIPDDPADLVVGSIEETINEWGSKEFRVEVTIDDPIGENYYELDIRLETYRALYDEFGEFEGFEPISSGTYLRTDNLVVPEYQYDQILFSDDLFDGRSYTLTIVFEAGFDDYLVTEYGLMEERYAIIDFRNCTKDYYTYYNTAALQNWNDGDPFAEPVPIYTNVKDGFGIWGGYKTTSDTLFSY